jgi:hypothetical protein
VNTESIKQQCTPTKDVTTAFVKHGTLKLMMLERFRACLLQALQNIHCMGGRQRGILYYET